MPELSSVPQPPTATAPSVLQRMLGYRIFYVLSVVIFVLDQVTKIWIHRTLPFRTFGPPDHIEVIPGFFNLVHVGNTGAAWSLFEGRSTMLALLALATLLAIFFWRRSLGLRALPVQVSFGLMVGGIVGNLVDRLLHGHVIDFLDFHFGNYIFPTFNIADSGICVGVFIYLWFSFRHPAALTEQPS